VTDAPLARHLLLRMDPRVHLEVGCGERGEIASETQRASDPAHHHDRAAAGRRPTRATAPADLARYTRATGWLPRHPAIARRG